jgi:hypothetical protein
MLKKGTNVSRGYVTTSISDGVNYREIADTMSELGFPMNHSSARNYVIRVMKKFVDAFIEEYDMPIDEEETSEIAKSPSFQENIAEMLQIVESERRENKGSAIITCV